MSQPASARPTLGIQIGNPALGYDVILPPTMTECQSFLVYFDISRSASSLPFIAFYTPDILGDALLTLRPGAFPGYIEWICDIPAGHGLVVALLDPDRILRGWSYVVDPGLTACQINLRNDKVIDYGTNFASYTSNQAMYYSVDIGAGGFTTFPDASTTLTANQLFVMASSTPSPIAPFTPTQPISQTSSITLTTPHPYRSVTLTPPARNTASIHKSNHVALAIGVPSGIFLAGLLVFLWFQLRRSRTWHALRAKQSRLPHSNTNSLPFRTRVQRLLHTGAIVAPNTMPAPYLAPPRKTGNFLQDLEDALRSAQLTSRQRQVLLAHLASKDPLPNATSSHGALRNEMRFKRSAREDHFLMLGDILAQLTPTDRRALVTFLGQSPDLNLDGPTRSDVTSERREAQPPPYTP